MKIEIISGGDVESEPTELSALSCGVQI